MVALVSKVELSPMIEDILPDDTMKKLDAEFSAIEKIETDGDKKTIFEVGVDDKTPGDVSGGKIEDLEKLVEKVNIVEDGDIKDLSPSKKSSSSKNTPKSREDPLSGAASEK